MEKVIKNIASQSTLLDDINLYKNSLCEQLIVARWGEIHLKGDNRGYFLKALQKNLKAATGATVIICGGRVFITGFDNLDKTLDIVANTFGIVSVSPAIELDSVPEVILEYLKTFKINESFKIEVNRANKNFPIKSLEFAAIAGGTVLDACSAATVDLHNPKTTICIDIRERTYVCNKVIPGIGGLPVGTAGRALVMLSGGIDSPVAAYLSAKRGLEPHYIHFYTPPFTSEFSLEKIRDLIQKLKCYCGKTKLYIVSITDIMEAIRKNCPNEFIITIMRRFMVRIAERVARTANLDCIITGECLSQVASQTIAGITSNNVCAQALPILRPLVTFDKGEIVDVARKINTYDTSCRPHPDCCSVFVPKHPSIAPKLDKVEKSEGKLDVEALINDCINNIICEPVQ